MRVGVSSHQTKGYDGASYRQVYPGNVSPSTGSYSDDDDLQSQSLHSSQSSPPVHFNNLGYFGGGFDNGVLRDVSVAGVMSVCFSPSGSYLACRNRQGEVCMLRTDSWEVVNGYKHIKGGSSMFFSYDEAFLACCGEDEVAIVDTASWDEVEDMDGVGGLERALCFSPNSPHMVSSCRDRGKLSILSTRTWKGVKKVKGVTRVQSLCFSYDGVFLACGRNDGSLAVLSTKSWEVVKRVSIQTDTSQSISVRFSPGGRYLACCANDRKACVLSTTSWEVVRETCVVESIHCVSFNQDDQYLACCGRDLKMSVVSTFSWEQMKEIELGAGSGEFVCFSATDDFMVCSGAGGNEVTVRKSVSWAVEGGAQDLRNVSSICFSDDGEFMACGGANREVSLVNTGSWEVVRGGGARIRGMTYVCFSRNSKFIACYGEDRVGVLSTSPYKVVKRLVMERAVHSMSFSNDSQYLVCGGADWSASIFSTVTWEVVKEVTGGGMLTTICFSPDSKLVMYSDYYKVHIMRTDMWGVVKDVATIGVVRGTCFSPDGQYMACTYDHDSVIKVSVVDTSSWQVVTEAEVIIRVVSGCFSPDSKFLALYDQQKRVSVMSTDIWKIMKSVEVELCDMAAVCFSPDSNYMVCGDKSGVVRMYHTSLWVVTQEIVLTSGVYSVCFSPNGFYLACIGQNCANKVIRVGPMSTAAFIPMSNIIDKCHLGPSSLAIPDYCSHPAPGPTLLQRCVAAGMSVEDLKELLTHYPMLLCAFRTDGDDKLVDKTIIATAIRQNNPLLLLAVLTPLVNHSTGPSFLSTSAMQTAAEHFPEIMAKFPGVWIKFLKAACVVRLPSFKTFEGHFKGIFYCLPAESAHSLPWNAEWNMSDGDVLATVVPIPGLGSLDLLKKTISFQDVSVMNNDVMEKVLSVMWREYIQTYFHIEFCLFVVMCVAWSRFLEDHHKEDMTLSKLVSVFVVLFIAFVLSIKEILTAVNHVGSSSKSTVSALRVYFRNKWNVVDVVVLVLSLMSMLLVLFPSYDTDEVGIAIRHVVNGAFLTLKFLGYLRGFSGTGSLITVLSQNMVDMLPFMLILLVILIGFTGMFRSLFSPVEGDCELSFRDVIANANATGTQPALWAECNDAPYAEYALVAFSVFIMGLIGDIDPQHLENSVSPWTARACYVACVIVVMVVGLNALIALLGDSYSRIQENFIANKNMERAKLVVELMTILPARQLARIERESLYLHVLVASKHLDSEGHIDDGDADDWEGSLNATKNMVTLALKENEGRLAKRLDEQRHFYEGKLDDQSATLERQRDQFEAKIEGQNAALKEQRAIIVEQSAKLDRLIDVLARVSEAPE